MSKRRLFLLVLLSYLGAWGTTFALGGPAVERVLRHKYGKTIEQVDEITDETRSSIVIDYTVPAPFVVRAETRYVGFMWCGEGAAWTLFTLPGKAWILSKRVHWFA